MFFFYSFLFFNFVALLLESIAYGKNIDALQLIYPLDYNEYKFYIFFLAFYVNCFVSLTILEIWYNKPAKSNSAKKVRRFVLFERKGFLNLFSLWLFRFVFILFIFHNASFLGCFPLYSEYKYLFYLLAIVLFSDLWIGFRRVYQVKWYLPLGYLFFIIVFSFSLSHVRPYNDKAKIEFINKGYHYKDINIPVLEKVVSTHNGYNLYDVYLSKERNVYVDNNEITLTKLSEEIYKKNSNTRAIFKSLNSNFIERNGVYVYIDKNSKMKDVKLFLEAILVSGVKSVHIKINKPIYSCDNTSVTIPIYLPVFNESFWALQSSSKYPPPPPPPLYNDGKAYYTISQNNIFQIEVNNKSLKLNDTIITVIELQKTLEDRNNKEKVISLKYDENIDFQTYLRIYNSIRNSVYNQRDNFSNQLTRLSFLELKYSKDWNINKIERLKQKEFYKLIQETHPFKLVQNDIKTSE